MDRRALRLAPLPQATRGTAPAVALGSFLLIAAAAATAAGAGRGRVRFDAAGIAETALAADLSGDDRSAVPKALGRLGERLERCPLDATTRTIYASLLAEMATTAAERDAAADEGFRALRTAPFEEGIARAQVKILARTGRTDDAMRGVRELFATAPGDAAVVLSEIEPFLPADRLEEAIPATADAWLARAVRLREDGREAEADARLGALLERWPDDLSALTVAAGVASGRGSLADLVRLVPPSLKLPELRANAALLSFRAHSRAAAGDLDGARRDAALAVDLSGADPWILTSAGDALAELDPALARTYWSRALRALDPAVAGSARVWILARSARLEEREGRAADALRRWREIVLIDPAHGEANRRIAALTGAAP